MPFTVGELRPREGTHTQLVQSSRQVVSVRVEMDLRWEAPR